MDLPDEPGLARRAMPARSGRKQRATASAAPGVTLWLNVFNAASSRLFIVDWSTSHAFAKHEGALFTCL